MRIRDFLLQLERFGIKLGLENISRLLKGLGNPQNRFFSVHVGGTNGKGSVLAFLDSILQTAGYKTGRYTSPHLINVNERFLVNSIPVEDDELDAYFERVKVVAEKFDPLPTFFEFLTATAFCLFADKDLDVALVEVGMGGRFDATNVLLPGISAITNIDLEHTRYLGDTLEKIAFEKAGIIKPNTPVVIGETKPGPLKVILDCCETKHSCAYLLGRDFTFSLSGTNFFRLFSFVAQDFSISEVRLGLAGTYQGENAAVATELANLLRPQFSRINQDIIEKGLIKAKWPCRMEVVMKNPRVIIDVAHNAAGAKRLAEELSSYILLFAVSSDKAVRKMLEFLAPKAKTIILTQFSGGRALSIECLCDSARDYGYIREPNLEMAVEKGLALATDSTPLVITGSLFLAGEARELLIKKYNAPHLKF